MLKICGTVNDLNEAKEVEEIIKVFIIKQRIKNLTSVGKNKKIKNPNLNFIKQIANDYKLIKNSDVKNF